MKKLRLRYAVMGVFAIVIFIMIAVSLRQYMSYPKRSSDNSSLYTDNSIKQISQYLINNDHWSASCILYFTASKEKQSGFRRENSDAVAECLAKTKIVYFEMKKRGIIKKATLQEFESTRFWKSYQNYLLRGIDP